MARTWLITGCSRGLGRALAHAVIQSGDQLVATARDPETLADLVAIGGDRIITWRLDVTDFAAAERAMAAAVDRFGGLDIVVNNAGYGNVAPIEDTSIDAFRSQIETNLFGTISVTKAAIPLFRWQGGGRFIQISSIGGRAGATGRAPYSAAKFGVEGFSEVLTAEMAPFGVHVTIIEPGGFRTDFAGSSTRISEGNPAYAATVGKTAAMQRDFNGKQPGDPAAAARAIIAIASSDHPPLRLVLGRAAYARRAHGRGKAGRTARLAGDKHVDRLPHRSRLAGLDTPGAIVGALQTRIKATGKITASQFAIILTIADATVTRFQMLEDSFDVSKAARG